MLITGKCICENCGNTMEWEYQTFEKNTHISIAKHDFNKYQLNTPRKLKNGQFLFMIECKECNRITEFLYDSELDLEI